jgi:APA family basic amino acid/polyamine antiporter/amino acid efflux transporter
MIALNYNVELYDMAKTNTQKIGLIASIAFAVGAMVGGGVFVLSGLALKQTGPSAILSFVIAGIMVLVSALSFATIASAKHSARYSGYELVGKALGSPIWSFFTSWSFYLAGIIGAAFVLNAFGLYLTQFFLKNQSAIFWALGGALAITLLNLGPASKIARVESFLVGLKLLILVLLIIFGIKFFSINDLKPFDPHGLNQILVSSAFLFIAFLGFNVINNISSDIKNPTKTIPRAIILSMLIVTIIYVGVVVALLAAHIHTYSEASVGAAAQKLIGPVGGVLIIIGALVSTLSSANANILGSSEIMIRLTLDKQVPTILGKLKHGHPYYSVLGGAFLYIILIASNQTNTIIGLANVSAIWALIIVNFGAYKLIKSNKYPGIIKLPGGKLLPVLGIIFSALELFFISPTTNLIGFGLILSGLILYLLRKRFHNVSLHLETKTIFEDIRGPLVRALHSIK